MFSFSANRKVSDASILIRRVIDLTSPNRPRAGEQRSDIRYNRSIPIVVCGWKRWQPDLESTVVGFTTDLCDRGMGIVVTAPIEADDILVTLLVNPDEIENPVYLGCHVEKRSGPSLGLYRLGLSLTEAVDPHKASLKRLDDVLSDIAGLMFSSDASAQACVSDG